MLYEIQINIWTAITSCCIIVPEWCNNESKKIWERSPNVSVEMIFEEYYLKSVLTLTHLHFLRENILFTASKCPRKLKSCYFLFAILDLLRLKNAHRLYNYYKFKILTGHTIVRNKSYRYMTGIINVTIN